MASQIWFGKCAAYGLDLANLLHQFAARGCSCLSLESRHIFSLVTFLVPLKLTPLFCSFLFGSIEVAASFDF